MNTLLKLVFVSGLFLIQSAYAEEQRISRSVGKLVSDQSINLSRQIQSAPIIKINKFDTTAESRVSPAQLQGKTTENLSARHDEYFEIYSASLELEGDLDDDGFYHALLVRFDADTNYDISTVYAKLYLSRNGGHWSHYFTTDLFEIYGNSILDEYEVMSELLEGYPPGYYDVLIELHSLHHADVVASLVLDNQLQHHPIALEDLIHDENRIDDTETVVISHGAGSFSLIGLLFLGLLIFQIFRSRLTLNPTGSW